VNRTYNALDAANIRIVAEHQVEVKEVSLWFWGFGLWDLAFEELRLKQD
jgi:hypothetical protein